MKDLKMVDKFTSGFGIVLMLSGLTAVAGFYDRRYPSSMAAYADNTNTLIRDAMKDGQEEKIFIVSAVRPLKGCDTNGTGHIAQAFKGLDGQCAALSAIIL